MQVSSQRKLGLQSHAFVYVSFGLFLSPVLLFLKQVYRFLKEYISGIQSPCDSVIPIKCPQLYPKYLDNQFCQKWIH